MKYYFLIILFFTAEHAFAQINYLNEGNKLLGQNKFKEAEELFRKGLEIEPGNMIYKNQIALSLINQYKNPEAEQIITEVLEIDSLNIAALWYGGINNFKGSDFRKALEYFEKAYPLIDRNSGQFYGVNYFIGKCFRNLLYTEGISFAETTRMLEAYKKYTELQPNAEDYNESISFIKYIEEKRPPQNVKKWVLTSSQEKAEEIIKKQLIEK